MRTPLLALILATTACTGDGRSPHFVIDEQGMHQETAAEVRSKAQKRIEESIDQALPEPWTVTITMAEEPAFDPAAESWRWSTATIIVALTGTGACPLSDADIHQAISEFMHPRLARHAQLKISIFAGEAAAAAPGEPYTVLDGDTLTSISRAFYGSPAHWRRIQDGNPTLGDGPLAPGTVLMIPPAP